MFEVKKCPRQNPVQMVIPPAQGFRDYGLSSVAASVFPDYRQLSLRQGFTIFSSVFQDDFHGEYPDLLQNTAFRIVLPVISTKNYPETCLKE